MLELTKDMMEKVKNECEEHHTALAPGYVKVSSYGKVEKYSGRYGDGYKIYHHNPNSTRWCNCTYWIRKEEK